MAVEYEWDVELQAAVDSDDHEEGEVLDHDHQLSYADAMKRAAMPTPEGFRSVIVLVRDDDAGRSWAYVENGKLAEKFSDANGSDVAKVPARFFKEIGKAAPTASQSKDPTIPGSKAARRKQNGDRRRARRTAADAAIDAELRAKYAGQPDLPATLGAMLARTIRAAS